MSLVLISSRRFGEHRTPPGHPERCERAEVMELIASRWRAREGGTREPRAATVEQLERVHAPEYIEFLAETAGHAVALDPDTYTSPESHEIALLAAGAAVDAVELVMDAESGANAVLAMVRPPGHHAEPNGAMGFCLYNNIAVAAAHARALGAERVAIVDYDVHHGNGTQDMFAADPSVLYISLHQFPFYPGTGAVDEVGVDAGEGFTVNVPLEVGSVDEDYRVAFAEVVLPILLEYKPDLLLVSAGFDAHERDPLAGMRLTTAAFGAMTSDLRKVAEECCSGRIVLLTEGGYDLRALTESLEAVVDSLAAPIFESTDGSDAGWPVSEVASTRGIAAVNAAKRAQRSFWKTMRSGLE
jgi:acetoin utilization deacetylase AcuC-like enzyme